MARKQALSRPIVLPEEPVKWARISRLAAVSAHGALSAVKLIYREPPEGLELLHVHSNQVARHGVKVLFARPRSYEVRNGIRNAIDFDDKICKRHRRRKRRQRSIEYYEGFIPTISTTRAFRSQRNHSAIRNACRSKRQTLQNARLQQFIRWNFSESAKVINDAAVVQPLRVPSNSGIQVMPLPAESSVFPTSIWSVQGVEGGKPRKRSVKPPMNDSQPLQSEPLQSKPLQSKPLQSKPLQSKPPVEQWLQQRCKEWKTECEETWKLVVKEIMKLSEQPGKLFDNEKIRTLLDKMGEIILSGKLHEEGAKGVTYHCNFYKVLQLLGYCSLDDPSVPMEYLLPQFVLVKDFLLRHPDLFNKKFGTQPSDEVFASNDRISRVIVHLDWTAQQSPEALQGLIATSLRLGMPGLTEEMVAALGIVRRICYYNMGGGDEKAVVDAAKKMADCFAALQEWSEGHRAICPIACLKKPFEEIATTLKAAWKDPPDCNSEVMFAAIEKATTALHAFATESLKEYRNCACAKKVLLIDQLESYEKLLEKSCDSQSYQFRVWYLLGMIQGAKRPPASVTIKQNQTLLASRNELSKTWSVTRHLGRRSNRTKFGGREIIGTSAQE